ncbi:hypothetical protein [Nocardia veterana]|uniref:Transcriptional regulator n=1 Tax=Nocardia veterana TaxID=132249 RepID=A0A7X6LZB3_9NOCA|nr:hypothetical protein [Nocardia veterana]NKY86532.1 hypothetical protein [Nocardia veterana]
MGRKPKQPNSALEELLSEKAISRKGLAKRVNDAGRAIGLDLAYDHTSVGRWLSGEQPNPPVPQLIAHVFTELLGRRITSAECGMSSDSEPGDLGLEFSLSLSEALGSVTTLWRTDIEQRSFLQDTSYAVHVYPAASMRWLTMPVPEHPVSAGRRRVGRGDVDAVRAMTAAFRDLDNRVGGGRVRPTVVHYLHTSVAPLLRGNYAEPIGRPLYAAAAELTKLAGWAAYDQEEHGLAQRYLIQALRLARGANDAGLGAEILAAMSHQATYVGRPGDAVDLARAAQMTARSAGLAALAAECHLAEAHGHAARRDDSACAASLNAAERSFEKTDADRPAWLSYFDGAYMSAKVAHCFRELGDDARTAHFAEQSLNMSDSYQRGKAFNLSLLASARVAEDPLEAVRVGREAVSIAVGLSSQRSYSYLRDLRHRLSPHTGLADIADFRQVVKELTSQPR